jgi:hypothetical protein
MSSDNNDDIHGNFAVAADSITDIEMIFTDAQTSDLYKT